MIKKTPKASLADKILDVLSAVPAQFDPDDDNIDDTRAKLVDFHEDDNQNEDDEDLLSKFRKKNVDLLADVDKRYAGKRGSRRLLKEETSGSDESAEEEEQSSDDALEENEADQEPDSVEASEEEEQQNESDPDQDDSELSSEFSEDDSNFQHMKETNASEQVKKGVCVRNQIGIWESLLEMRIQMQKCLVAANKMPQKTYYRELVRDVENQDFKKKIEESKNSLCGALDKLLTLQSLVIKKFPETKSLGKKDKNSQAQNESDEEIPSDTDEEVQGDEDEDDSEEEIRPQKSKKRKLKDYENDIADLHSKYKTYRNETIEKWNTKTR